MAVPAFINGHCLECGNVMCIQIGPVIFIIQGYTLNFVTEDENMWIISVAIKYCVCDVTDFQVLFL